MVELDTSILDRNLIIHDNLSRTQLSLLNEQSSNVKIERMSQFILRLSIVEKSPDGNEKITQNKTLAFEPKVRVWNIY